MTAQRKPVMATDSELLAEANKIMAEQNVAIALMRVVIDHPILEWLLTDGLRSIPEPQRTSVRLFLIPAHNRATGAME